MSMACEVKAKAALRWPVGCEPSWFTSTSACNLEVEEGEYGTVQNTEGKLAVVWDQDEKSQRRLVSAKDVAVVPRGWGPSKTLSSRAWDMVSGIGSSISSTAESLVASLYSPRQTSLAHLFSGSVSKWIVCPIRNDADLEALDSQLGVEDPAMQDCALEAIVIVLNKVRVLVLGADGCLSRRVCLHAALIRAP